MATEFVVGDLSETDKLQNNLSKNHNDLMGIKQEMYIEEKNQNSNDENSYNDFYKSQIEDQQNKEDLNEKCSQSNVEYRQDSVMSEMVMNDGKDKNSLSEKNIEYHPDTEIACEISNMPVNTCTDLPMYSDLKSKQIIDNSSKILTFQKPLLIINVPHLNELVDFTCQFCGKEFSSKSSLKEHSIIHSGEQPFSCEICGKKFNKKGNKRRHENTHGGEKKHTCGLCGKSFNHACTLKDHMKKHTGEKPHECHICKKQFSEKCNLKRHIMMHNGVKPHSCNTCGKTFTDLSNLGKHILVHTGERPHKCEICGKTFRYGNTLQRHHRIHTGEAPFTCPVCSKAFFSNGELHNHSFTHSGIKRFKCEQCGKSFSRNHHLQQHLKHHSGEKPYKCDICGGKFVQSSGLRKHMKTFHPTVPTDWQDLPLPTNSVENHSEDDKNLEHNSCNICGMKFVHAKTLQKHIQTFHSAIPMKSRRPVSSEDALITESILDLIEKNQNNIKVETE